MAFIPFAPTPMKEHLLKEKLTKFSQKEIDLTINENHSTFLSVQKKGRHALKLSLHKLFLHGGDPLCKAVVHFSLKKDRDALKVIRSFAHSYFATADYSSTVDAEKLRTKGVYFDLEEIYNSINKAYFQDKLRLKITWFKKPRYRTFSYFTLGSYNRPLKLVRINDILDQARVPLYFIEYVVYHEMLHHICPGYTDENGREHIHTSLFRKKEKEFLHYAQAKEWEKKMKFGR